MLICPSDSEFWFEVSSGVKMKDDSVLVLEVSSVLEFELTSAGRGPLDSKAKETNF